MNHLHLALSITDTVFLLSKAVRYCCQLWLSNYMTLMRGTVFQIEQLFVICDYDLVNKIDCFCKFRVIDYNLLLHV